MHWLFLLLALAALAVAVKTTSVGVLVLSLLAGLGLILAFVLKLAADRVSSRSRDEQLLLDPEELRRLREQAEARKLAASQSDTPR
ncbi:MAG TPA: hypothetical protein VGQ93_09875 [Lysobacter sp.]|jgi:hypothetical protein|nr:hypothetical protein [Lysobacter sp.]